MERFLRIHYLKWLEIDLEHKEKRYSSVRCLCFDYEKIVKNYEDYVKEEKPTNIVCKPINNDDVNDANDANIESLFKSFPSRPLILNH